MTILYLPSPAAAQQYHSEDDEAIYYVGSAILSLIHIPMKLTACVGTGAIAAVAYGTIYQLPGGFEEGMSGKQLGDVAREACTGSWLVASNRAQKDQQTPAPTGKKVPEKEQPPIGVAKAASEKIEAPSQAAAAGEAPAEKVVVKEVVKEVIKEVPKIVEAEEIFLPDVAFRFDSADLSELGKGRVYLAAQKLKEKSDRVVVISGHADHVGADDYNKKLSLRRADTVKRELIRLGVNPANIVVESFGESQPLLDQKAGWARAVNRRVEIKLKKK